MTKALLLLAVGAALLTLSLAYPVAHPLVGVLVGGFLVMAALCVLWRKRPKPVERDEHERGVW
jgi:hypothetical protein